MITVVMYHQEVYLNTIFSDEAMLTVIGAGGSELPETGDDTNLPLYVDTLRSHALRTAEVDVRPGDALLTLTTCLDDDRLVIVARKLRANETDH